MNVLLLQSDAFQGFGCWLFIAKSNVLRQPLTITPSLFLKGENDPNICGSSSSCVRCFRSDYNYDRYFARKSESNTLIVKKASGFFAVFVTVHVQREALAGA